MGTKRKHGFLCHKFFSELLVNYLCCGFPEKEKPFTFEGGNRPTTAAASRELSASVSRQSRVNRTRKAEHRKVAFFARHCPDSLLLIHCIAQPRQRVSQETRTLSLADFNRWKRLSVSG
ncbi:hypothetical protein TGRUB_297643 [Toxoplasma gondii RUB]|uniref:Uncharacterized protein n=1 Tax=Toxoplasma gondii RUB TaxID=935652 RepID=A0A086LXD9_TOXGO|nr:hypothetical protein TGRUB_297643 [Toxoplasma gondii RUB]